MTLDELNDFLLTKTWDDAEAHGDSFISDWAAMVDAKDKNKALVMVIRWFNANRPDEGYLTLVGSK